MYTWISFEPYEGFGENTGREMLKVQNSFRKLWATKGRSAVLMLCLCMALIIVLSGTQRVYELCGGNAS